MKKDYIGIQVEDQDIDDLAFVDQYWTERWYTNGLENAGEKIGHLEKRSEYKMMQPYLQRLGQGTKFLDAGCGLGEWTVLFSQQGFDVIGLDISLPASTALEARFLDIVFVHSDIRQMNFPDNHFDALFSWGGI